MNELIADMKQRLDNLREARNRIWGKWSVQELILLEDNIIDLENQISNYEALVKVG